MTMSAATLDQPTYIKSPKTRPQRAKPITQAIELQELLFRAAHGKETTPAALAQVARAWSELEERKRILGMKPKPKDVDVAALQAAKAKRNAPSQGFTETPIEKGKTPKVETPTQ